MAGRRFRTDPGITPSGRATTRNFFGFTDGIGNPDTADPSEMIRLVWIQPGAGESAWCVGGSYVVVRFAVELRDADSKAYGRVSFVVAVESVCPFGGVCTEQVVEAGTAGCGFGDELDAYRRIENRMRSPPAGTIRYR